MAIAGRLSPQTLFGRHKSPLRQRSGNASYPPHASHGFGSRSRPQTFSGDLWGAVNALSYSLCPVPEHRPGSSKQVLAPPRASADACVETEQGLRKDLDFTPSLSVWQRGLSVVASLAVCFLVYYTVPVSALWSGWKRLAVLSALAWALYSGITALLAEKQFQDREKPEQMLGAADSLFAEHLGLSVHYKRKAGPWESGPDGSPMCLMHCYHGFGANTFSWDLCQQDLADKVDGIVTAHDSPGFGLTQRPLSLDAYTSSFNGQLGTAVLDGQQKGGPGAAAAAAADETEPGAAVTADDKPGNEAPLRVLMGHSMGGAAVVEEVIRAPEQVDCVVLVSPAVIAFSGKPAASTGDSEAQVQGWRRWGAVIGGLVSALCSSAVGLALLVVQPALVWILRALVRSRTFWEKGLSSAWYDSKGLTPELVDAYRMPQLVRGWEFGMLRFLRAKVVGSSSFLKRLRSATEPAMLLSTADRFADAVRSHGIKVLLIHGVQDQLVPVSNSRRLAAKLGPTAALIEVPRCGHQPQEEMPQDFVKWVSEFVVQEKQAGQP